MDMSSIHGHEVMEMMLSANKAYNKESLQADIVAKFGADARFHTCSAQDMDAAGIVEFLAQRGKFVSTDAGFNTDASLICNH